MWKIWWLKTVSLFDVWSIDHFVSGIWVWIIAISTTNMIFKNYKVEERIDEKNWWKKLMKRIDEKNWWKELMKRIDEKNKLPYYKKIVASFIVLFLAYAWETLEHYLEVWLWWARLEYWFQWVEFWANRLIFDPLLVWLWFITVCKYPKIALPARIFNVLWLSIHLFYFPNSMYLQYIIDNLKLF